MNYIIIDDLVTCRALHVARAELVFFYSSRIPQYLYIYTTIYTYILLCVVYMIAVAIIATITRVCVCVCVRDSFFFY